MFKQTILSMVVGSAFGLPASAETCVAWFNADHSRHEEPQETARALLQPDCYAWRLFIALNWPANSTQRRADPSATFGDARSVTWETWRNVRNSAPDTAFPADGSDPGPWLNAADFDLVVTRFDAADAVAVQQRLRAQVGGPTLAIDDVAATRSVNEARMNKATYRFVKENELYSLDGQIALAASGTKTIDFGLDAKEVKAQWREIGEADKARYHWAEILRDGETKTYGLTALHVTTKDLPNWFWATFEHIDNRESEDDGGRRGNEGWLLPSIDRFACPAAPHDCDQVPSGIGLEDTRWENYRLRGAQVDFVDSRGNALILANSQPEQGFQTTSSCITCHALASIDNEGQRLRFFDDDGNGPVGIPQGFVDPVKGEAGYTQLDFVWSFFRARPKQ